MPIIKGDMNNENNQIISASQSPQEHYVMPMKPVKTRIGIALHAYFLSLWFIALGGGYAFLNIVFRGFVWDISKIWDFFGLFGIFRLYSAFFSGNSDNITAQVVIFYISGLLAAVPILIVSKKRISRLLGEKPDLVNDIFYRRAARSSFWLSLVMLVFLVVSRVFSILNQVLVETNGTAPQQTANLIFLGIPLALILYSSWKIYKKSAT